ncbi:MAG: pilus assembly protein PilM [Planctomycetaceae bacterium]|nr:pilus assembly protein PilM [Planctomycetaceae bacterium]
MLRIQFKTKSQPIGLDIGHSLIKMIQLSRTDQSIRVEAAQEEPIDRSLEPGSDAWRDHVAAAIGTMFRRGGFQGRRVVSCLPGDILKIKSMRLDTKEPNDIRQVMRTEVAQRLGLNPDCDELRYLVAGHVYQGEEIKNEVIFFGIEREKLVRHIELLERAGLVPVSIDTVPCALFRSFQTTLRRREDRELVSVFADLGNQFTTVIIGKGQDIVFVKLIPVGGEHLNRQVAERLQIDLEDAVRLRRRLRDPKAGPIEEQMRAAVLDAMSGSIEDLAREISLCFKYYTVTFRGQRPAEAVFAGGEAYESALMEALGRHLQMDIKVAEPLRGYDLSRVSFNVPEHPQLCEWAIAVGLGLKGMELAIDQKQEELTSV